MKFKHYFKNYLAPLIFWAVAFGVLILVAPYCWASTNTSRDTNSIDVPITARLIYSVGAMKQLFCQCEMEDKLDACNRYTVAYNTGDYDPYWQHPKSPDTIVWIGEYGTGQKCEVEGAAARSEYLCEGTIPPSTLECLGAESGSIPDELPVLYHGSPETLGP